MGGGCQNNWCKRLIRIQWAAYILLSSLFSLTLSTKLRIWPRSENPDLARSKIWIWSQSEKLDLDQIGKCGSGPDQKMRIWPRWENSVLAPIGKYVYRSAPDRKIRMLPCPLCQRQQTTTSNTCWALDIIAVHLISGIMRVDFSYACGPIPNHGALFIIQYLPMLPWPW